MATGPEIDVEDLPDAVRGVDASARRPDERPLADRERAYIQAVLDRHHGNRRRAAEELGIFALHAEAPLAAAGAHAVTSAMQGQI